MSISVIGYEEHIDPYNKDPVYCTKCGKLLKQLDASPEYNTYTGLAISSRALTCPTLSNLHDIWKREQYGAWVNYRSL